MNINFSLRQKPDLIGVIASSLCMIHCFMTPVLFAVQSFTVINNDIAPIWWSNLDFLFIIISFFAIFKSSKNSTNRYIKFALWASWFILFFLILNEKLSFISLSESIIYIVASGLALLHLYNLNYCQCTNEDCCNSNL